MSLKRRAARRDENEPAIVFALQAEGATVERLDLRGVPDLLVGYMGWNLLMEVKNLQAERGQSQARKLTEDQAEFHRMWQGTCYVVYCERDALELLAMVRAIHDAPELTVVIE